MNLGKRLKTLRLGKGMTLRELSVVFGVSVNSIHRWEHNLAIPRKAVLERLAEYYGVTPEWLEYGIPRETPPIADAHAQREPETVDQLLKLFKRLPENMQYKVLGYVERLCMEVNQLTIDN